MFIYLICLTSHFLGNSLFYIIILHFILYVLVVLQLQIWNVVSRVVHWLQLVPPTKLPRTLIFYLNNQCKPYGIALIPNRSHFLTPQIVIFCQVLYLEQIPLQVHPHFPHRLHHHWNPHLNQISIQMLLPQPFFMCLFLLLFLWLLGRWGLWLWHFYISKILALFIFFHLFMKPVSFLQVGLCYRWQYLYALVFVS